MTVRAKVVNFKSGIIVFLVGVFLASGVLFLYYWALKSGDHSFPSQSNIVTSFLIAPITGLGFVFLTWISNISTRLSIADSNLKYSSFSIKKTYRINDIKDICLKPKYHKGANLSQIEIRTDNDKFHFFEQLFKENELRELYKRLITNNSEIVIDDYIKNFINRNDSYSIRTKNPKYIVGLIITIILLLTSLGFTIFKMLGEF